MFTHVDLNVGLFKAGQIQDSSCAIKIRKVMLQQCVYMRFPFFTNRFLIALLSLHKGKYIVSKSSSFGPDLLKININSLNVSSCIKLLYKV